MDFLTDLNPAQREAVLYGAGPILVLAGAGSGKTRVITCRIVHLIQSGMARADGVYAVTFTNKAANEMKERVASLLPEKPQSGPWVSTFHSLGVRLLRSYAELLGYSRDFTIFDSDDQLRLIKSCLKDLTIPENLLPPRKALSLISLSKNSDTDCSSGTPFVSARPEAEYLAKSFAEYTRRLQQANAMDFDDLLGNSVRLLEEHPEVRRRYQKRVEYLLVDEYQDTNLLQHRMMQLLTDKPWNICAVGDEDQSIYSFRGARVGNILSFEQDFPGTRVMKLEQNYRSTRHILEAASTVVGNNRQRREKALWTENQAGDLLQCFSCSSGNDEAQRVCRTMMRLRSKHPNWNFAILYRTNFQSRYFEEELRRNAVPFRLIGALSFYARAEIKDILSYLRFLRNQQDSLALERIINTPPRGIGEGTIQKIKSHAFQQKQDMWTSLQAFAENFELSGRIQKRLQEFVRFIAGLRCDTETASLPHLILGVAERSGYLHMLQEEGTEEAKSRLGNIKELATAAKEWEMQGLSLTEFLDRAGLASDTDNYDQRSQVTLMTLHSAKGLEFDTVFLVGMEEGLFPHQQQSSSDSAIEEERRLCYVGMTRARTQLYLSWTAFRRTFSLGSETGERNKPSRFLQEIPTALMRMEKATIGEKQPNDWQRYPPYQPKVLSGSSYNGKTFNTKTSVAQFLDDLAQKKVLEEPTPSSTRRSAMDSGFGPGTRVRHPKFGTGRVMSAEKQGRDVKLVVQFDLYGYKKLLQSFSKLIRI